MILGGLRWLAALGWRFRVMIDLAALGPGLQYGTVQLVPADDRWVDIAESLAATIRLALTGTVAAVEHVGSTAVPGLLAKPIVDLAVGLRPHAAVETSSALWLHSDGSIEVTLTTKAGGSSSWKTRPGTGSYTRTGVCSPDRSGSGTCSSVTSLRRSETARGTYEFAEGRWSYSLGKTTTVLSLLGEMRGVWHREGDHPTGNGDLEH